MRIFVSIPTTNKVNKRLESELKDVQKIMKEQDIRYLPPDKWHITLVFLGEQSKPSIDRIKSGIQESLGFIEPVDIKFESIQYPPGRDPRMIWAKTDEDSSIKLESMKGKIVKELKLKGVQWKRSKHSYKGHITLARFDFNNVDSKEIKKKVDIQYKSPSIQLLKSELKPGGAEYTVLEEFKL